MPCLLSIVVPVYNEQQTLPQFLQRIRAALAPVSSARWPASFPATFSLTPDRSKRFPEKLVASG